MPSDLRMPSAFQILPLWPFISAISSPSLTLHRRRVVSLLPVTARAPSGEKATALMISVWPTRVRSRRIVVRSQMMAMRSLAPEISFLLSGENDMLLTTLLWPLNSLTSLPVEKSYRRTM